MKKIITIITSLVMLVGFSNAMAEIKVIDGLGKCGDTNFAGKLVRAHYSLASDAHGKNVTVYIAPFTNSCTNSDLILALDGDDLELGTVLLGAVSDKSASEGKSVDVYFSKNKVTSIGIQQYPR